MSEGADRAKRRAELAAKREKLEEMKRTRAKKAQELAGSRLSLGGPSEVPCTALQLIECKGLMID
jgi:hypothetical protein